MADSNVVFVRFNSNTQIPVPIDARTNVKTIKEAVARQHGVRADEIRLIFAGQELREDLTLADCSVQSQSILHAVSGHPVSIDARGGASAVAELELASMSPDGAAQGGAHDRTQTREAAAKFYVYCKDKQCKGVRPGKLRVRCLTCKESTMVLSQDPTCWEDVLTKNKLRGNCAKQGCAGKIAEFYFKCAGPHRSLETDTCVALHHLRSNTVDVECGVCFDTTDVVVVFPCNVGHSICLECFYTYAVASLNDRNFKEGPGGEYTLGCPVLDCAAVVQETHHFHLLGPENYARYQRFATEQFVIQCGGLLCPGVNCGNGILPEGNQRKIQCPFCNYVCCRLCKSEFHQGSCNARAAAPAPTPADQKRSEFRVTGDLEASQWGSASQEKIRETTRPCPKCNIPVEKNGGCMHMTCTMCKFNWCWLCGVEWGERCRGSHWFG